ncbi:MAG: hypothetical protein WC600_06470 [Desulfobaccales bacterium]
MARPRSWTWTVIISLLVGIAAATAFWQYSPYGHEQVAQQSQSLTAEVKGGALHLKKSASQATGSHFQMVTDGKQVFIVDLKSGRVWRYFHQTKEEGFSREDEGFLPIPFYYAGKKHYSAAEIEPPAGLPGNPAAPAPEENQPR